MGALQQSIQTDGWIGAMTTAADGEVIAGSARIETVAQVFGTDAEPIVIESDGTRPVVVVRKDIPNAADKRAQRLALADNRVHEIDLAWDVEVLAGMDADVLGELWTGDELSALGDAWANDKEAKAQDAALVAIPEQYMIIVECASEAQQAQLLEKFTAEGLSCRALLS